MYELATYEFHKINGCVRSSTRDLLFYRMPRVAPGFPPTRKSKCSLNLGLVRSEPSHLDPIHLEVPARSACKRLFSPFRQLFHTGWRDRNDINSRRLPDLRQQNGGWLRHGFRRLDRCAARRSSRIEKKVFPGGSMLSCPCWGWFTIGNRGTRRTSRRCARCRRLGGAAL